MSSRLRTKLFDRTTHKLVLTGAGSSYVDACKRILAEVSEAERAASGEYVAPTGELTVTAPVGIGRIYLIPILADFFKAYPEIDACLIMTNRVLNLQQEQIDVGVRLGALPDSSIIAIRVGAVRRVVCASPAYLAARGTPRTPDDLAGTRSLSEYLRVLLAGWRRIGFCLLMSKRYYPWKIDEPMLLPARVQEFADKDHLARFVLSFGGRGDRSGDD